MRELLGDKDNRRLHLIEMIYLKPGIDLQAIADSLDFSFIQAQTDVAFLNEMIAPLSINVTKDRRCYLEIPDALSTRVIYKEILAQNINFRVLEALLLHDYETYDQLCEKLYISVATLKRVIHFINECFEGHDVAIKTRPLRIVGNEHNIRAFFVFYLNERYIDDIYPLPIAIQTFGDELVSHYLKMHAKEDWEYAKVRRLKCYLYVAMLRETKLHTNPEIPTIHASVFNQALRDVEQYKNFSLFQQVFKMELDASLYLRMFDHYMNDERAVSIEDLRVKVSLSHDNQKRYDTIKTTIQAMSERFSIPVTNQAFLELKLYNLMRVAERISITPYVIYPNRKIFLMFNKVIPKNILDSARDVYAQSFKEINQKNDAYFYEFLYILVTHWEGFYGKLREKAQICKIALFFNSDYEHMIYMKNDLEFQHHQKVKIDILSIREVKELIELRDRYDLFITNFILPQSIDLNHKVISVTDSLWHDKQQQIQNYINMFYYNSV